MRPESTRICIRSTQAKAKASDPLRLSTTNEIPDEEAIVTGCQLAEVFFFEKNRETPENFLSFWVFSAFDRRELGVDFDAGFFLEFLDLALSALSAGLLKKAAASWNFKPLAEFG